MARTKPKQVTASTAGPKLESKLTPRVVAAPTPKPGGLPVHPGVDGDSMLALRLGSESAVRLPDACGDKSATTVLRNEYTLSADAAGQLAWGEAPGLANARRAYVITAGVLGTATGVNHPQMTAFSSEARNARMVAMKITVTYIGQEQLESGYLSFSEFGSTFDTDSKAIDVLHTGCEVQARPGKGLQVWVDFTQEPRWEVPGAGTFMDPTFPFAMFFATGLEPSKATFRVRVVRWMEFIPLEGSLSEGDTAFEPPDPAAMMSWGVLNHPQTSITTLDRLDEFYKIVRGTAMAAYHLTQPLTPYVVPAARKVLRAAFTVGKVLL